MLTQGDLTEALRSYRESLVIAERLAKADPSNAVWQHDLALSHGRVASVLASQGNLAAALDEYRIGHAIIARLKELSPDNAALSDDLAWFDAEIAKLEQAQTAEPGTDHREQAAQ